MTTMQDRFEMNVGEVAAKVIDGEAILINLTDGMYFSMDEVGTMIWELLERGHSLEQVANSVSEQYDVGPEQAASDVQRLVAELHDARLIEPTDGPAPTLDVSVAAGTSPYAEPRLNSYGDMGDLLALDPPMPGIVDTPWTDQKPSPGPTGDE